MVAMITAVVQKLFPQFRRDRIWPWVMAGLIVWASNHGTVATPKFTQWIPSFDKVAHFSIFGLLATLMVRAVRGRWAPWVVIALISVFGVTDEWHQSFVPGRSCDVLDWLADTLGAALAVSLYCGWAAYRNLLETSLWRRVSTTDGHGDKK